LADKELEKAIYDLLDQKYGLYNKDCFNTEGMIHAPPPIVLKHLVNWATKLETQTDSLTKCRVVEMLLAQ
jgi:hypothetical protein